MPKMGCGWKGEATDLFGGLGRREKSASNQVGRWKRHRGGWWWGVWAVLVEKGRDTMTELDAWDNRGG